MVQIDLTCLSKKVMLHMEKELRMMVKIIM